MSNCLNFWCSIRDTCIYRDSTKGCSDIPFCKVYQNCEICSWKKNCKRKRGKEK